MSSRTQQLAVLLERRREQLWRLQNTALRLTVEGPSPDACLFLADGLAELAVVLQGVAAEAFVESMRTAARLLGGREVAPRDLSEAFELVEALTGALDGANGQMLARVCGETRQDPASEGGSPTEALFDRPGDLDAEDLRLFAAEAREHIEAIEVTLVELESSRDLTLVSEIFRGAHSIKGAAQYLGLEATSALSHRAEAVLERLRSQRLALAPHVISLLLRSFDALSTLIGILEKGDGGSLDVKPLVLELDALIDSRDVEASTVAASEPEATLAGEPKDLPVARPNSQTTETSSTEEDDSALFAREYRDNAASARDLLRNLPGLIGVPDKTAIASRSLHSLKGLAGLVGLADLERLAGALDAVLNGLVRSREVAPGAQEAVDGGLDLMEAVFRRHTLGEGGALDVDSQIAALEAVCVPRGSQSAAQVGDAWDDLGIDSDSGPLVESFRQVVDGLRRGEERAASMALASLAKVARLQGCDEVAHDVALLGDGWKHLDGSPLRTRVLRLRSLVQDAELAWRPPSHGVASGSFSDALSTVPGIGPKKLRRLTEAGATSAAAVRALGLQGLISIPGISIEQARMLLANCGGAAPATATSEPDGTSFERQVLDDDYDRELVSIYLDTTMRQIDMVRTRLREGAAALASETVADLVSAARYMGYSTLVDSFGAIQLRIDGQPGDVETNDAMVATVRSRVERLRSQLALGQDGVGASPSDSELREIERIFSESALKHLSNAERDLRLFLASPDERLLAALQHHLSCLHSAATNVGRDGMAVDAEALQRLVEEKWLAPRAQGADVGSRAVATLGCLFEACGLPAPRIAVRAASVPDRDLRHQTSPVAGRGSEQVVAKAEVSPISGPGAGSEDADGAPATPQWTAPEEGTPRQSDPESSVASLAPTPSAAGDVAPLRTIAQAEASIAVDVDASTPEILETARALVDAQATVRVDTAKIDDLLNMVAELVVNRSAFMVLGTALNELANRLIDSGQLGTTDARDLRTVLTRYDEAMTEQGRVSNQLQQGVMLIRMMPVNTLFSKVPRLVRDLAMRESRRVKVVCSGEETELDKTVIERLSDPLVHLIRNAVSHGIESPEERLAAGKPAEGRLHISARHQGNIVIIEVEDDGRGVDFDKIRRRWVESGLGSAAQVARLSPRELMSALFLPGFSTAERVTDISGRGVGLDVVKRNIENLGGQVEATTDPGRFSRFTIRIPLTMAIMQALLVRVASEIYAIPGSAVIEAERITRDQIYSVENQKVITLRKSVIPLVNLDEVFAYNYYLDSDQKAEGPTGTTPGGHEAAADDGVHVVVLQGEGREIGVVVSGLIGSQDIVIKSLEDDLVDGRGIAGASILGDGTVALILDVGEICKMVMDGQHSEELRRRETMRQFERYLQQRDRPGVEALITDGHVH